MVREPYFWIILFWLFIIIGTIILDNGLKTKTPKETQITCTENYSQMHGSDGWKKIETVDYQRIGALVSKGKAEVECRTGTLMCTVFVEGKAYPETKGCLWYWRGKRSQD